MSERVTQILVVYKKSAYRIYFEERRVQDKLPERFWQQERARFEDAHHQHYETLEHIRAALIETGLPFKMALRSAHINYSAYDLIVTVGGDGTFLEAARHLTHQRILGVNSNPAWSVGNFCACNKLTFRAGLAAVLQGQAMVRSLQRLAVRISGTEQVFHILNDVLVAHESPAAMSRYYIETGGYKEEQRSSGLWLAPAAGSTGAVLSAGGCRLPLGSRKWQYRPRELYRGPRKRYHLRGSVLTADDKLVVSSLMRSGRVYLDGDHVSFPFSFGGKIQVGMSNQPLNVVWLSRRGGVR